MKPYRPYKACKPYIRNSNSNSKSKSNSNSKSNSTQQQHQQQQQQKLSKTYKQPVWQAAGHFSAARRTQLPMVNLPTESSKTVRSLNDLSDLRDPCRAEAEVNGLGHRANAY